MTRCYIGVGSNLNNPLNQLNQAKNALDTCKAIKVTGYSSIYQSEALTLNDESQNDYLNAVIQLETDLSAENLLDVLQEIETTQGRVREKRWGARTIDLDIILFAELKIDTDRLTVPHTELENRNFVLTPLAQIDANITIPGKNILETLLKKVSNQTLNKVGEFNG